jgi:hypothetical protein
MFGEKLDLSLSKEFLEFWQRRMSRSRAKRRDVRNARGVLYQEGVAVAGLLCQAECCRAEMGITAVQTVES